ncbi:MULTISPECIES: hypothetical protein [unclassified Streptomyces]|uniref:hypothetical protein n=1 Tax=unclassified Streptomyces TaxID=2593676 RepID=UPI00339DC6DC
MATAARPYTRQRLIEARQLIPASDGIAEDFGFTLPVAYSLSVWSDAVHWAIDHPTLQERAQQERWREWYLLLSLYGAIRDHREGGRQPPARLDFEHYRFPGGYDSAEPGPVRLVAEKSRGDHGEQVITIMRPDQHVPWI